MNKETEKCSAFKLNGTIGSQYYAPSIGGQISIWPPNLNGYFYLCHVKNH